jgi:hypothetical protein
MTNTYNQNDLMGARITGYMEGKRAGIEEEREALFDKLIHLLTNHFPLTPYDIKKIRQIIFEQDRKA